MASEASGAKGAVTWGVGVAVVAAVIAGALYMSGFFSPPELPETATNPVVSGEAAPETATAPSQQAAVNNDETVDPEPENSLPPPAIDVVRVEPDGSTVIAGKATPGSRITILLDGDEQGVVEAGADGAFVSLLTLPVAEGPRILSVLAQLDDLSTPSDDQIILAPSVSQVAESGSEESSPDPTAVVEAEQSNEDQSASLEIEQEDASTADQTTSEQPDPEVTVKPEPSDENQIASLATEEEETSTTDSPAVVEPAAEPFLPSTNAQTVDPENATDGLKPDSDASGATQPDAEPETPSEKTAEEETVPTVKEVVALDEDTETTEPISEGSTPTEPTVVATETSDVEDQTVAEASSGSPIEVQASSPEALSAPSASTTPAVSGSEENSPSAPEPAPVAVLRAGVDGVELVQPPKPEAPSAVTRIALDTISYSDTGEVLLSGRGQGSSVVRIYLDNTPVTDFGVDRDGRWKGRLAGIQPGVYTLRLDELDDGGRVLSRLETPFKREAPEALQPPVSEALADTPLIRAVTVQTGDTLWAISRERYGDGVLYVRVFEANKESIKNPDLIYPGQVFTIPE